MELSFSLILLIWLLGPMASSWRSAAESRQYFGGGGSCRNVDFFFCLAYRFLAQNFCFGLWLGVYICFVFYLFLSNYSVLVILSLPFYQKKEEENGEFLLANSCYVYEQMRNSV